jgi:hypothetical protein
VEQVGVAVPMMSADAADSTSKNVIQDRRGRPKQKSAFLHVGHQLSVVNMSPFGKCPESWKVIN